MVEIRERTRREGGPSLKRFGITDLVAVLLALLTFGVIIAVLVQNFIGIE